MWIFTRQKKSNSNENMLFWRKQFFHDPPLFVQISKTRNSLLILGGRKLCAPIVYNVMIWLWFRELLKRNFNFQWIKVELPRWVKFLFGKLCVKKWSWSLWQCPLVVLSSRSTKSYITRIMTTTEIIANKTLDQKLLHLSPPSNVRVRRLLVT